MATIVYWVGGAAGGPADFNNAANWNPAVAPSADSDAYVFEINSSVTLQLTSNVAVYNLLITNNATVTLNGAFSLTVNGHTGNAFELDTGSALNLGPSTNLTLNGSGVSFGSGTGTAQISGGTITNSVAFAIGTNQILKLINTTLTSYSPITGSGTLELNGTTASFPGAPPSVNVYFDHVTSGGAQNVLNVGAWANGLNIQNFGFGDEISEGGLSLALVATGTTIVNGQTMTQYTLEPSGNNASLGTVTLAPGTPGATPVTGGTSGHTINLTNNIGTEYTYPCFYPGTMLATEDGEIAVENVTIGTLLNTASGELLPVRWVGWSEVAMRFADPLRTLPIRIKADALADGVPARDLLVSPDHAIFVDGMLVQASALVNGTGIIREEDVPESFRYYHVEFATHELLLADGCPAESFVDNIDRMNFHNWEAREAPTEPVVEMDYPRAKSARQVPVSIRSAIAARATRLVVACAA